MNEQTLVLVSEPVDGVATVTLNCPERMNVFNLDMAQVFVEQVERLGEDSDVRAIVLRGAGRMFSGGGDIEEMLNDVRKGDRAAYFRAPLTGFNRMGLAIRSVAKPVLAAVHGAVAGVAFNLILHCDMRIAAHGTKFTQAFVRIGLSPDGGGTWLLSRLVGHARACEMTMLPTVLDADQAQSWGLVNRVVPVEHFEEATRELAGALASGPTKAIGRTKQLLYAAENKNISQQMEDERLVQIENAASPDFEEGLAAFVEKRQPEFTGR